MLILDYTELFCCLIAEKQTETLVLIQSHKLNTYLQAVKDKNT
jgi:hypothetical protein